MCNNVIMCINSNDINVNDNEMILLIINDNIDNEILLINDNNNNVLII